MQDGHRKWCQLYPIATLRKKEPLLKIVGELMEKALLPVEGDLELMFSKRESGVLPEEGDDESCCCESVDTEADEEVSLTAALLKFYRNKAYASFQGPPLPFAQLHY